MKIQDYIKKHSLTLWRKYPQINPSPFSAEWMPAIFLDDKEEKGSDDKFEVFANEEKTRFVSINVTQGMFRIVHYELLILTSEWQPTHLNFKLQGIL
jgi:hypothetical protein